MAAPDPVSLVEAAVRAACLARAPRRTVQAVAAAVVSALSRPSPAVVAPRTVQVEQPKDPGCPTRGLTEEEKRTARADKRRRKRQRRAAKAAAAKNQAVEEKDEASAAEAEGVLDALPSTPRRAPPPSERPKTGETPLGKRPCKQDDEEMTRRMSDLSVASDLSGITLWTQSDGGSPTKSGVRLSTREETKGHGDEQLPAGSAFGPGIAN